MGKAQVSQGPVCLDGDHADVSYTADIHRATRREETQISAYEVGAVRTLSLGLFSPPAFLNVPLPWPCRLVIQGSPPPSPGNTFYFLIFQSFRATIPVSKKTDPCSSTRDMSGFLLAFLTMPVLQRRSLALKLPELWFQWGNFRWGKHSQVASGSTHSTYLSHKTCPRPALCYSEPWLVQSFGNCMWGSHRKHLCVAGVEGLYQWEMTSASITRNSSLHVSLLKRRGWLMLLWQFEIL